MADEKKDRVVNKIEEWNTEVADYGERLKVYLPNINYSFTMGGIRVGFQTMEMDPKSGVLQMNNVLLSYPSRSTADPEQAMQNFIVYRKVFLYGNILIYPS